MLALVIGGSGSGKSEYAENLSVKLQPCEKLYIATMYPWDEESRKRIDKHRNMRAKKQFETIECFYDLKNIEITKYSRQPHSAALLDCMSNLVSNEMYCEEGFFNREKEKSLVEEIIVGIQILMEHFENVIIVSNDVFTDGVDYGEEMQQYLSNLGAINSAIAEYANVVVEVVCGIPRFVKNDKE